MSRIGWLLLAAGLLGGLWGLAVVYLDPPEGWEDVAITAFAASVFVMVVLAWWAPWSG
jgi:hypothetical protein